MLLQELISCVDDSPGEKRPHVIHVHPTIKLFPAASPLLQNHPEGGTNAQEGSSHRRLHSVLDHVEREEDGTETHAQTRTADKSIDGVSHLSIG